MIPRSTHPMMMRSLETITTRAATGGSIHREEGAFSEKENNSLAHRVETFGRKHERDSQSM